MRRREKRHGGTLAAAYMAREAGRVEPLVAVYDPEALPLFRARMAQKPRAAGGALPPRHRQCRVPYATEESPPFFNINRPADLAAALEPVRAGVRTANPAPGNNAAAEAQHVDASR